MSRFYLTIQFLLIVFSSTAQLWVEDFTGESNGATTGTAGGTLGGTWTSSYTGSGRFSRQNNGFIGPVLYAEGTSSEATWSTNTVDISSVGYAIITADIFSAFVESNDYVRISYVLDGVETQFYELIGGNGLAGLSSESPASAIVAGNTLQVKFYVRNDAGFFDDVYAIDNVAITAAPVIYSRKSGTWTDKTVNGTWSLVSHTGASCSCVPLNTQVAIIGNGNTVTLPVSQTTLGTPPTNNLAPGAVDVRSTGILQFNTNGVTLGIQQGLLRVRGGGLISSSSSGITGEQIAFNANVPAATFQVDAGGNASFEDLAIGPNATNSLFLKGGGSLSITDDILVGASNAPITNNFSGTVVVGDQAEFQAGVTGSSFTNNYPLSLTAILFNNDNCDFINNATLNVTDLRAGAAGDDNNTFTNSSGATLNVNSIVPNNGNLTISNAGIVNQDGNFSNVDGGSSFVNQPTGTWNWSLTPNSTFDADMSAVLNCSAAGNTFNYSGTGAQSVIPITYHHLYLSGSGSKSVSATLRANGDLTLQNSVVLSPGANAIDVGRDLSIMNTAIFDGTGNLTLGRNWFAMNAASFVEASRTVTFDGAAQDLANTSGSEAFYNLTLTGSGTKLGLGVLNIDNTLSITGSAQLDATADLFVGGNWTVNSSNTNPFIEGSVTVFLNGGGAQVISTNQIGGETFYNLSLTGNGLKSNTSRMNIIGDLSIGGGSTTQLGGTGDVFLAGNWNVTSTHSNPFIEGTRTVTLNGTAQQTISTVLTGGETFYRLTVNNGHSIVPQIILSSEISISNTLNMTDGVVRTSAASLLTMLNGSASNLGSANSYVDGPMQYDMAVNATTRTLNFPIGKAGNYGAVALRVRHTSAVSYSYTAEVINSSARTLGYTLAGGTDKVSGLRYWDIRRGTTAAPLTNTTANLTTTGSGNAPRITLYYVNTDEVTQPSTLTIVKNINSGNTWNDLAATATGTPTGSVTSADVSANFTSFSYFTLANKSGGTNPLPVELIYFKATPEAEQVNLQWETATEKNNAFFTVERAIEIESFAPVGNTIAGNGTTKDRHHYNSVDSSPVYGRSYYRLKQTDFDGKYSYSPVVTVDYNGPDFATLRAYPNPAHGRPVTIRITGLRDQRQVPLQIIDTRGQLVYQRILEVITPGSVEYELQPSESLQPGMYIIRAGSTIQLTQKLFLN